MSKAIGHQFQWHNYKRPTFCAHCGNLLVGVIKQGLRCKRCNVDVHQKCQDDLKSGCVGVVEGQHKFKEKTYMQPTYCDVCDKLLVGVVNQGKKCTECGTNIHDKCQSKVQALCARRQGTKKQETASFSKKRTSKRIKREGSEESNKSFSSESETQAPTVFATMSAKTTTTESSEGGQPSKVENLNEMVGDVMEVMKQNANKMNERQDKLEILEVKEAGNQEQENPNPRKEVEMEKVNPITSDLTLSEPIKDTMVKQIPSILEPDSSFLFDSVAPVADQQTNRTLHAFASKTYHKPTYCVHCTKLLVGIINQGKHCSGCGVDIHTKCVSLYNKYCTCKNGKSGKEKVNEKSSVVIVIEEPKKGTKKRVRDGKHLFSTNTYFTPTNCHHCEGLLVGVVKQGLQCKFCHVDLHPKCVDGFISKCEANMEETPKPIASPKKIPESSPSKCPGKRSPLAKRTRSHSFKKKTYHKPTYCEHCTKLLVGIVNQGEQCSDCGVNIHFKCEQLYWEDCKAKPVQGVMSDEDMVEVAKDMEAKLAAIGTPEVTRKSGARAKKKSLVGDHVFVIHTYKRPTFCAYCKKMLYGLYNQGMRCKDCSVDVHVKCQGKLKSICASEEIQTKLTATIAARMLANRTEEEEQLDEDIHDWIDTYDEATLDDALKDFGITIELKKKEVLRQKNRTTKFYPKDSYDEDSLPHLPTLLQKADPTQSEFYTERGDEQTPLMPKNLEPHGKVRPPFKNFLQAHKTRVEEKRFAALAKSNASVHHTSKVNWKRVVAATLLLLLVAVIIALAVELGKKKAKR